MRVAIRRKHLSPCASFVGIAFLSYASGAAAMFYQLPSSEWLTNAFLGARSWRERPSAPPPAAEKPKEAPAPVVADVDRPDKTCDGFTLYTCTTGQHSGTQAWLVNMRREVVHLWTIPFGEIRPDLRRSDNSVSFFATYLYPNGDLLAVCQGARAYGLAKFDAASNLIWFCPRNIHHDVDVAEDGTIYAVEDDFSYDPPKGLEGMATPYAADSLLALSPDGKPLREPIPLLRAICESPYAALLANLEGPEASFRPPLGSTAPQITRARTLSGLNDATHTNCVRVLRAELAPKFPSFQAGQVLVSLRSLSVLALIDPLTGRAVWAARGPWLAQHDPQFLENGHLLVFDNLSSPRGSRVLEYDPQAQALPWSYPGTSGNRFYTSERGMNQRLPNGNTFIVISEAGKMIEVTFEGELVWSHSLDGFIASGRRYLPEQLEFLPANTLAR